MIDPAAVPRTKPAAGERKVKREWNKWINQQIREMEDYLIDLKERVMRVESSLAAAKWIKQTQNRRRKP